jgi:hypothetical protein
MDTVEIKSIESSPNSGGAEASPGVKIGCQRRIALGRGDAGSPPRALRWQ